MTKHLSGNILRLSIVILSGLIPAIISQFTAKPPSAKHIHIRNFRYGKDPSVIRCNRGDTLHLTFSSEDTGHSFLIQEFDVDAKVSPSNEEALIFRVSDPTETPVSAREVTINTGFEGIRKYLQSKINYRCHVWCGPMHAFEMGKMIILPNTLLSFSLGCLAGIFLSWLSGFFKINSADRPGRPGSYIQQDLLSSRPYLRKVLKSRFLQVSVILLTLAMIYIVILTTLFGTKMSGRNLGVLLMWAVWLFLLVAVMTPAGGRIWCSICPLPFFGDWIQRHSFSPSGGKTGPYNNTYHGLFRKWPEWLNNSWLRLFIFLVFATFSTTMVARPFVSGIAILLLLLVPTLMAFFWEHRAFCRFVCPVSVFVSPFSHLSIIGLRKKSAATCDECRAHYCQNGNSKGWACPYGLNVRDLSENSECGLCMECLRSCTYDNVTIYRRPFGSEMPVMSVSQSFLTIAIFTVSIIYSILYLGHWPGIRDYVNILDKGNWNLFGLFSLGMWITILVIMPSIIYLFTLAGLKLAGSSSDTAIAFKNVAGSLLPLGMMLWVAFVIPMLFTNVTFILQSLSDPFGWGWDFFGTAGIPWRQFAPGLVPWLQGILILAGTYFSLRNLKRSLTLPVTHPFGELLLLLPTGLFITAISASMLLFFTN
ncbi:MAG: 4Fe-4S binding protein [Bacteroidales bacterium]|nr:4Fe-4S binding protein [Bacteroidales bacterium]